MPRLFTLQEATALLPRIVPIIEEIVATHGQLQQAEQRVAERHWQARGNGKVVAGDGPEPGQQSRSNLLERLGSRIAELSSLDVELKDPAIGLIDFRSQRDDRVVYLCWKLGERTIEYWHELDAGYAGRQPL